MNRERELCGRGWGAIFVRFARYLHNPPMYCCAWCGDGCNLAGMDSRQFIFPVLLMAASVCAQTAPKPIEPNGLAQAANSEKTYAALREDLPGSEGVMVKDFTLEREGGKFT